MFAGSFARIDLSAARAPCTFSRAVLRLSRSSLSVWLAWRSVGVVVDLPGFDGEWLVVEQLIVPVSASAQFALSERGHSCKRRAAERSAPPRSAPRSPTPTAGEQARKPLSRKRAPTRSRGALRSAPLVGRRSNDSPDVVPPHRRLLPLDPRCCARHGPVLVTDPSGSVGRRSNDSRPPMAPASRLRQSKSSASAPPPHEEPLFPALEHWPTLSARRIRCHLAAQTALTKARRSPPPRRCRATVE